MSSYDPLKKDKPSKTETFTTDDAMKRMSETQARPRTRPGSFRPLTKSERDRMLRKGRT